MKELASQLGIDVESIPKTVTNAAERHQRQIIDVFDEERAMVAWRLGDELRRMVVEPDVEAYINERAGYHLGRMDARSSAWFRVQVSDNPEAFVELLPDASKGALLLHELADNPAHAGAFSWTFRELFDLSRADAGKLLGLEVRSYSGKTETCDHLKQWEIARSNPGRSAQFKLRGAADEVEQRLVERGIA